MRVRPAVWREEGYKRFGVKTDWELAVKLGIHPSTLSNLLTGNSEASERTIVIGIDKYELPFEELFEIRDEPAKSAA